MAKHEVVIHENTGSLKTVAPYLGVYVAKETVKIEGFIAAVAIDPFKSILAGTVPVNNTEGASPIINTVLDEGAMEYGQITIGAPFSIAGADLGPDMEKTDEYVALLDGKGEVVAKAEISYSDLQNVKGVFEGVEVEAGEYTLAVFTRSGMGEEYGVKKATRKVTVM